MKTGIRMFAAILLLISSAAWHSFDQPATLNVNGGSVTLSTGDQAQLPQAFGWKAFVIEPLTYNDAQAALFEGGFNPVNVTMPGVQHYPYIIERRCNGNLVGITNLSTIAGTKVNAAVFGIGEADTFLLADGRSLSLKRYSTVSIVMPSRRVKVRLQASNGNRMAVFWAGDDQPVNIALNSTAGTAQPGWAFLEHIRAAGNTWDTTANWMGRTILIANLSPNDSSFTVTAYAQ